MKKKIEERISDSELVLNDLISPNELHPDKLLSAISLIQNHILVSWVESPGQNADELKAILVNGLHPLNLLSIAIKCRMDELRRQQT